MERWLWYCKGLLYVFFPRIEDCFYVHQILKVSEFNEDGFANQLYKKVNNYLNTLASVEECEVTNIFSGRKHDDLVLQIEYNQPVHDSFLGAKITWTHRSENHSRSFLLRLRRNVKRRIIRPYLAHINSVSDEIEDMCKELKLYTNVKGDKRWKCVPFTHPTTFDTIAMDGDLKSRLRADLEAFLNGKNYYHRLGRVWKRSYLLYGPSGTGKSSYIAAMANFLSYDVYDINISKIQDSSELKTLLLHTTIRSIIVVEDLDLFLVDKKQNVTGILNYMDGVLSSCCGDERVMVYTMSSGKDQIDPTILRPGRIDVHINFPLCDFNSFKLLASSYLSVADHKLFPEVEEIFMAGARLSLAEISELMVVHRQSPKRAIRSVISALQMVRRSRVNEARRVPEVGAAAEHSGELRKLLLKMKSCTRAGRWM